MKVMFNIHAWHINFYSIFFPLSSHSSISHPMTASGSDQSTKNELPPSVLKRGKYVCDLIRQCSKVGELRTAIQQGVMTEKEVGICTIHTPYTIHTMHYIPYRCTRRSGKLCVVARRGEREGR
ncbi:hypothetical protein EON63_03740 [archaeon]|nr:MAG: hypothetical protein EON63_03740 [archaeon]